MSIGAVEAAESPALAAEQRLQPHQQCHIVTSVEAAEAAVGGRSISSISHSSIISGISGSSVNSSVSSSIATSVAALT